LRRIAYRYDLDAVEFNSHVRYQPTDLWSEVLAGQGRSGDAGYTFKLRFPFKYRNEERVIEIDRIVCFPVSRRWRHKYSKSLIRGSDGLPMEYHE